MIRRAIWWLRDVTCELRGHIPFYAHEDGHHLIGCVRCGGEWRLG